jgi:hypothetical protein
MQQMPWYAWLALGTLAAALMIVLVVLRERLRAKADKELTAEELRRKRTLEEMSDNLSP